MPNHHASIESNLRAFTSAPLQQASLTLLGTLGYSSDKTIVLERSKPQAFLDLIQEHKPDTTFDQEKALFADWESADLLFQLTDKEISLRRTTTLFPDNEVNHSLLRSYLFFAIELSGNDYARGKLTAIARQINRVFPMPVMVLIKHRADKQSVLSIAVINRRQDKRAPHRDVLGKVTIIRDISLTKPHRGHLDILDSFAFDNLVHPKKLPIADFDTLHATWEQIFNVELLNERFYKELANWYFWALPQVEFPADLESDKEKRHATALIRLLTRLIFCWFLKEKGLIPEELFHSTNLADILKNFDHESKASSSYYQAILQNLFFATLNQRMGKDGKGNPYRIFAKDEGFLKNRATYGVDTLYRYEKDFRDSANALNHFADIPFLNGGLFECLDRTEEKTDKKRYIDGFSRTAKKRPVVPNHLFFSSGETADLSTAYGDKKRKGEQVTGLIIILNRYKFTIVENTPIDQEIALDPELLGKVFENLLASYNEETKTTARKQTGSFYTPRPIVDYMVDESLKAHFTRVLVEQTGMSEAKAKKELDILFAYTEQERTFTSAAVAALITAIDEVKILDPACGSGAFPMGALHKLVYILGKLDPGNERWKQTQLAKLDSAPMREELERAFTDNDDDYGRKLYLIENGLYGVDIQPIAIQIAKLRFFISLICDQKTNRSKKENHGIRPLPNLETKFVAADTLLGLPEIGQMELVVRHVDPIEEKIEVLYHRHFSIQRRDQKLALQQRIKALRQELGELLAKDGMSPEKSRHVAEWDPFDPQFSADFFDPHWMFGRSLKDGFDIVIGNPPYISVEKFARTTRQEVWRNTFKTFAARGDIYCFFYERGLTLLRKGGLLGFITSNKFQKSGYGKELRKLLAAQKIEILVDFCELPVFEASTDPIIVIAAKTPAVPAHKFSVLVVKDEEEFDTLAQSVKARGSRYKPDQLKTEGWSLGGAGGLALVDKIRAKGTPLIEFVNRRLHRGILTGLKTGLNEAFVIDRATRDRLIHEDKNSATLIKPWIRGMDIKRWAHEDPNLYFIQIPSSENACHPWTGKKVPKALSIFKQHYPAVAAHLLNYDESLRTRTDQGAYYWELRSCAYWQAFATSSFVYADIGKRLKAFHSTDGIFFGNTVYFIPESEPWIAALLTSTALDFYYRHNMQSLGDPWTTGRMRFFSRSMNQVPIPPVNAADKAKLTKLAERAAKAAKLGDTAAVTLIERDIDEIVYRLFGLTEAEIAHIETVPINTRSQNPDDD